MQLQLALDFITIDGAMDILRQVGDVVDIVEVGTPFVVQDGMAAVRAIRSEYPGLVILADLKIMDAGAHETKTAVDSGADIVTALGAAADATIIASVQAARKAGAKLMVDLIDVTDIKKRAAEIDKLGVDYICVHSAFDLQATGKDPLEELLLVQSVVKNADTAIAGGIRLETLPKILKARPSVIIVGGGITGQADMRATALKMKELMDNCD